jgi:DNA sulfur modification protein DndC
MLEPNRNSTSAYEEFGLTPVFHAVIEQIKDIYTSDDIPWVVGYSGGKDSTAVAQLVWMALSELPVEERSKTVYIISTDTLVENPVVSDWVNRSLALMNQQAKSAGLPIEAHGLIPEVKNSFWTNLIGRGYPAPRPKFRWCTERLKIKPTDVFIKDVVKDNGEAIVVLGTRKAESTVRAARMKEFEKNRAREFLSPSTTLLNALIYSPIEAWDNDDVWIFLGQFENPWGFDNKALLDMYRGATVDQECPLVVDTSTESCGSSRFGCWVCTMVEEDKSMAAMVNNDDEKKWMEPLLNFRNQELKPPKAKDGSDHHKRDFRRMSGQVNLLTDPNDDGSIRTIPGPYIQSVRVDLLRKLLKVQQDLRNNPNAPSHVGELELITMQELHEIRRIWVVDKHEIEDFLPSIYEEETGCTFPKASLDDRQPFDREDMELLKQLCGDNDLHFELVRELLDVERSYRTKARRSNLFERIEKAFRKSFYESADDAIQRAAKKRDFNDVLDEIKQGRQGGLEFEEAHKRIAEIKNAADQGGAS